jgi:two-component system nitrogen regulation response regulator GlnG
MRRLAALARDEQVSAAVAELWIARAESTEPAPAGTVPSSAALASTSLETLIAQWLDRNVAQGPDLPEEGLYDRLLAEFERPLLETALLLTRGNQLKAARMLGLNRNTLRKMLSDRGVEPQTGRRTG